MFESLDAYFVEKPAYAVPAILIWTVALSALLRKMAPKHFSLSFGLVLINCGLATLLALAYLILANSIEAIVSSVIGMICFWGITFHLLAYRFGPKLTASFGNNWVKVIDYFYLSIGSLSVVRLAISKTPNALGEWEVIAVILVGVALALRLTKTSIEIFKWDRLGQ